MSGEVGGAFGEFFYGGDGPTHAALTGIFQTAGYALADPYDSVDGTPNKQQRVLAVFREAERRTTGAQRLVRELLDALRIKGYTLPDHEAANVAATKSLRSALAHLGWDLTDDGRLQKQGDIDLSTGGRAALDEQLTRLRRNSEDPAALLGGAKDLLESVAKFVLEEAGRLPDRRVEFPEALSLAFEHLGLLPTSVDATTPGGKQLRAIYQSARTVTTAVNELRNLQGTGHGRTLPTGVTREAARFVIREATHVAELMLATHDRQRGH